MSNANSYELAMLDLINGEREAAGLEPLRLITTLNDAAETHSAWMLDTDMFSHDGEGGSSPSDRMAEAGYPFEGNSMALENIGWQSLRGDEGIEDDVAQVHTSLMNSPGHRANILNPEAEDIGIGIETGTFAGQSGAYDAVMVTQVFGSTDADISAWVDPGTVEDLEDDDPIVAEDDVTPDDTPVTEDDIDEDDTPIVEDDPDDEDTPLVEDDPIDEEPVAENEDDPVDEADDADDEDDDEEDDEEDDASEDEDTEDGSDEEDDDDPVVVAEDDAPEDMPADDAPECDVPNDGAPVLPFELSQFTVDLRDAFEFTREGDQLIWETSEEKLVDLFLTAFEDWAMIPPEDDTAEVEADMSDLMIDATPEETIDMGCEADPDDWLLDCSA